MNRKEKSLYPGGSRTGRFRIGPALLAVLLVVSLVFSASGCGQESGEGSAEAEAVSAESGFLTLDYTDASFSEDSVPDPVVDSSGETLTVKDCIRREVSVPKNPERIAVLDSFAGEAVVMIGAGNRMVTCPNGVKSDSLLCEICPELEQVTVVMSGGSFNAEALLELAPDVILVKEALYAAEEERSKLDKLNLPYLVISYGNMAEQMYALAVTGAASGEEAAQRAQEINAYYCDVIRRVCRAAETIPESEKRQSIIPSMRRCAPTGKTAWAMTGSPAPARSTYRRSTRIPCSRRERTITPIWNRFSYGIRTW